MLCVVCNANWTGDMFLRECSTCAPCAPTVQIGGRTIQVYLTTDLRADDGDKVDGLWRPDAGEGGDIQVEAGLPSQARDETIWHEIFHAMSTIGGRDLDENDVQILAAFMGQLGVKPPVTL